VLGLLLAAVAVPEEDVVYYQEVDFVLSRDRIVTIRKTPGERPPFDPSQISNVCDAIEHEQSPGMIAYYLVDDVAERYIDLLDALDEEIDELEEGIDTWTAEKTRRRIAELRHDLLHIRKTLAPTRDAVREVVDGRVDIEAGRCSRARSSPGGRAAVRDDVRQAAPRRRRRRVRARPARRRGTISRRVYRSTRTKSSSG
jgi:Mg2+ and Co2+ transporter CorA